MVDAKNYSKLPNKPGVYFFYDETNKLLYIGKAKNLNKRVSSYFIKTKKDYKTTLLVKKIAFIDYLVTNSEVEAILTEQNLISKNQPPYNIQLKDSKSFSIIVISKEDFPKIKLSKQNNKDIGYIFGPYISVKTAKTLYEFVLKNFKLRVCNRKMDRFSKACLNYHLNLCTAPCERKVTKEEYQIQVRSAINFLKGKYSLLLNNLKKEIENASKNLEFEIANDLKEKYEAILKFKNNKGIKYDFEKNTDFISLFIRKNKGIITLLKVEDKKKVFSITKKFSLIGSIEENLPSILISLYSQLLKMENFNFPEIIYLPISIKCNKSLFELIKQSLTKFFNYKSSFKIKNYLKKNELKVLIELLNHQKIAFKDIYFIPSKKELDALTELKNLLNLKSLPSRIEGFDISNFDSKIIVGSSVSFFNGIPDKSNYRQYNIRSIEFQNDVESISEIVARRLLQYINSNNKLPDLLLIDGGKPQVNKVKEITNSLNIDVNIVGLAKKKETIVFPGKKEDINLPYTSSALRLLIKIRDEAHRFSNRYRKIKDNKSRLKIIK